MFLLQAKNDRTNIFIGILGLLVIFVSQLLGMLLFMSILKIHVSKHPELGIEAVDQFLEDPNFSLLDMDLNLGLMLMIIPFIVGTIGIWFWITKVHKRSFKSLITPLSKIKFKKIFYAFGVWLCLCLVMEGVTYMVTGTPFEIHFDFTKFAILCLIAVFLLPIQTTYEELFIRSYMMQVMSKVSDYRWVPIVVSVIFFALLHAGNPEIDKYGFLPMMTYYVTAAVLLAVITIMDDGLELAIGVHWATNLVGTVVINYDSSALQTYSLLKAGESDPVLVAFLWIIASIIFVLICSKKYNWRPFNILLQKIENNNEDI